MRATDLRYEDDRDGSGGRPSFALSVVIEEEELFIDARPDISSVEKFHVLISPPPAPVKLRVIGAVVEFALGMRHRLSVTLKAV